MSIKPTEVTRKLPGNIEKSKYKVGLKSSAVFREFVTLDRENAEVSGEKILSDKCYKRWLMTRKNKIKHPEDSFRRTLLAHLRGSDGRKPFSPKVEESLLKKLRTERFPWGFLKSYKDNYNPTRRAFSGKYYGFHEKTRATKFRLAMQASQEKQTVQMSKINEQIAYIDLLRAVRQVELGNGGKLRIPPTVDYALEKLCQGNKFLQREEVLPLVEDQCFSGDSPILRYTVNQVDCSYYWLNDVAENVFGNVSSAALAEVAPDPIEFLSLARHVIPMSTKSGKGWYRKRHRTGSGDYLRLLVYFEQGKDNFFYFLAQVVN
eukprot:augustus_masked-scaffold_35-processed-gene-2.68-mRNA-1 protein AED:0.22 eAED:1.00 QI:0/-1/0/1/-1/1/1/0/318